jgi:hypothetical protein
MQTLTVLHLLAELIVGKEYVGGRTFHGVGGQIESVKKHYLNWQSAANENGSFSSLRWRLQLSKIYARSKVASSFLLYVHFSRFRALAN